MYSMEPFVIGETSLDLERFEAVCCDGAPVALGAGARARVVDCCEFRRRLADGDRAVYGVNTGFGRLADTRIPVERAGDLQENLVRSHAVGWGPSLDLPAARAVIFLRALSLSHANSGARPEIVEALLALLASGLHPWIPSRGSVGASGDLAPLAHLALLLMGEGDVLDASGEPAPAGPALAAAGIAPLRLEAKEGLALINGTQLMNGLGLLGVARLHRLARWSAVAAALSLEALEGSVAPLGQAFHALRPHPGICDAAAALRDLLAGSPIVAAHHDCPRVQDSYSVRCAPQVLGSSVEAIRRAAAVMLLEAGSVTDNPVFFPETGEVVSGGHFHGQPLALQLDGLALAASEIASVAERRIYLMLGGNGGRLPRFLAAEPGLESGLMIAQYLAAALVSENKCAVHPASADSIPTSMGQEDHVSMGSVAALKLEPVIERTETVVALELLTAGRALQFVCDPVWAGRAGRERLDPGQWTSRALAKLAATVDLSPGDRPLTRDVAAVAAMIRDDRGLLGELAVPLAPLAAETDADASNDKGGSR